MLFESAILNERDPVVGALLLSRQRLGNQFVSEHFAVALKHGPVDRRIFKITAVLAFSLSSLLVVHLADATPFLATGSLNVARADQTATLLSSGRVLVAGGFGNGPSSAELYDPATAAWVPTAGLNAPRADHTATLLPNGRVLVAGGSTSGILSSAEVYDPASGTWTFTGSLTDARYLHTATLLRTGKLLVAGGGNSIEIGR